MRPLRYFAMDTAFDTSTGSYTLDSQWAMLADIGYDGGYLSLWDSESWADLPRLAEVSSRSGLDIAGVYLMADITADDHDALLTLPSKIVGTGHLDLALRAAGVSCSDRSVEARVVALLMALLERAVEHNIVVSLYHHVGTWLETIEDAVRLCNLVDHPHLKVTFCGYHWHTVQHRGLGDTLSFAAPFLGMVNLAGVATDLSGNITSIVPLDAGSLDNFAVLGALRAVGYDGWIGVQGFSVGGDVYTSLRRSLAALRDMESRTVAHPSWTVMRRQP